jgi:uncharacterized membrane protein YeaQ/YmgE (transglycosylase-associated protein family)
MRRTLAAVAAAVAGYLVGAFGGGFLVTLLSSNVHDRDVEAAMTGAFVLGPIGAVVGLAVALRLTRR